VNTHDDSSGIQNIIIALFSFGTAIVGFVTAFISVRKKHRRKNYLDHSIFVRIVGRRERVQNEHLEICKHHQFKLRNYLILKLDWWVSLFTEIIEKDFYCDGKDITDNPNRFAKWFYNEQTGFLSRKKYLMTMGVSETLIDECNKWVTADIGQSTHAEIERILSDQETYKDRYHRINHVLQVFAYSIILDTDMVVRNCINFSEEAWQ